jgi:hypothetical protein
MSWFRKGRRQDVKTEEPNNTDVEKALAEMSARLMFLEVLTSHLAAELPQKKLDVLLERLQEVVGDLVVVPPPEWVPPSREMNFDDELRSAIRLLIEKTTHLKRRPTNR